MSLDQCKSDIDEKTATRLSRHEFILLPMAKSTTTFKRICTAPDTGTVSKILPLTVRLEKRQE